MSAFGALPLRAADIVFDAVAASSNKCIEGVPGLGFVLARRPRSNKPRATRPRWCSTCTTSGRISEKTGQYRFTPPIHVIVAFHQALWRNSAPKAGVAGRGGRYAENCEILIEGMSALGFEPLLPKALQAPIIVTFRMPADKAFVFQTSMTS
jgi:2-aminoethylphosphonate-pyruvate transaminase